jgi:hypothetical protein
LGTEIRDIIEEQINHVYQTQNMLEGLEWIIEIDGELHH